MFLTQALLSHHASHHDDRPALCVVGIDKGLFAFSSGRIAP
jgi:hypothetical protein